MLALLFLLLGFLNLGVAVWERPRGRMLPVTVLGRCIIWGLSLMLLDISKIFLSASPKWRFTLVVAEGLETWTRSIPMALGLALIAYTAASEDRAVKTSEG